MGLIKFSAAVGAALVICGPANAAVTAISSPDAGYLAGTSLLDIGADDFSTISSLGDGVVTMNFSPVEVRTASVSWGPWGAPPETEGDMPKILYAAGLDTLTFDFDTELSTFGFEAQPDAFDITQVAVDYYLDGVYQGSVGRDVDPFAGARLLAANGRFDRAVVSVAGGFGAGQFRYAVASVVPEPGAWALMIAGFGAAGTMIRLRRRSLAAA